MTVTDTVSLALLAQVLHIDAYEILALESTTPLVRIGPANLQAVYTTSSVNALLQKSAYIGNASWDCTVTVEQLAAEENSLITMEEACIELGHDTVATTSRHAARGMFPVFRFGSLGVRRVVALRAGVVAYRQYLASTIVQHELAAILGVKPQTIHNYVEQGLLVADQTQAHLKRYRHEAVDAFLRPGATRGSQPWHEAPPFARLHEQGTGCLLTRAEAKAELGINEWHMLNLEASGELPVLKFGPMTNGGKLQVRYTREEIDRVAVLMKPGYTIAEAMAILCISRSNVLLLIHKQHLTTVRRAGDQVSTFVTTESIDAFLAEHLVGISPSVWIEIALDVEQPPVIFSSSLARAFAEISERTLRQWLASGELPHLRTVGGEARIMREHLAQYIINAAIKDMV